MTLTQNKAQILLPPKVARVFSPPRGSVQYRGLFGGRGSGKSQGAAKVAATWAMSERIRVLCAREYQASIKESFHMELKAAIEAEHWLAPHYDVGVDYLRCTLSGSEFIFRGLRHNSQSIKSLSKIDLTIVEEAEDVPETSWLALEATVFRQPKSELWGIWNPRSKGSPVDKRLRLNKPANAIVQEVNWKDNPFFPKGLQELRKRQRELLDPATYAHIWEGAYLENSDAQVLAGKVQVATFEPLDESGAIKPDWQGPYFGMDFGFAKDPTTAVEVWLHGDNLYIRREAHKVGLELDATAAYIQQRIPLIAQYATRADSARPESISYLSRHGLPRIEGVKKWPGSVEDGIQFLRSFRNIVIHPECPKTIDESRLYSYKVDKNTGDVLPTIVDAFNHCIDAIRYAITPLIKARTAGKMVIRI
jgi:phage terminase large subunit